MKSPVATAALSSVRVAREARAPSTASRSRRRSPAKRTRPRTASANASASASTSGGSRRPSPPSPPPPHPSRSFATRRLRSFARWTRRARRPGGLRETLGSDPTTVHRLVDALCAAGMLPQACAFAREMLEAGVRAPPEAIATLVRHGARAGMPDGVRDAFEEYVRARRATHPTRVHGRRLGPHQGGGEEKPRSFSFRRRRDDERPFSPGIRAHAFSDARASDTAAISAWKSLVAASREDASLTPDGAAHRGGRGVPPRRVARRRRIAWFAR